MRHKMEEHTVPWIAALTTYFGYAVLILFGVGTPLSARTFVFVMSTFVLCAERFRKWMMSGVR